MNHHLVVRCLFIRQKMIHNNSNDDDDCGSVDGAQQHAEKLTATFSFPGGMSCAPSLKVIKIFH